MHMHIYIYIYISISISIYIYIYVGIYIFPIFHEALQVEENLTLEFTCWGLNAERAILPV